MYVAVHSIIIKMFPKSIIIDAKFRFVLAISNAKYFAVSDGFIIIFFKHLVLNLIVIQQCAH